jgi:hypothetical protein
MFTIANRRCVLGKFKEYFLFKSQKTGFSDKSQKGGVCLDVAHAIKKPVPSTLKGQCYEIFASGFFMNQSPPSP